jgi:hypothetical protein
MKKFNEIWTKSEIEQYVRKNGILVLFENKANEYAIVMHVDKAGDDEIANIKSKIYMMFASHNISDSIMSKINEIAIKLYNKVKK